SPQAFRLGRLSSSANACADLRLRGLEFGRGVRECSPTRHLPLSKNPAICSRSATVRSPLLPTFLGAGEGKVEGPMARVVVVETQVRARAGVLLQKEGLDVVTLVGMTETSQQIAQHRPDVVLLEVDRADRSVLQLCQGIRAAMTAPVMLLCAHYDER